MPYQLSPNTASRIQHHQSAQKMNGVNRPSTSASAASSSARSSVKSKSHSQTKAQWKETIRKGCLERAKLARKKRLLKARSLSLHGGDDDRGEEFAGLDGCHEMMADAVDGKRGHEVSHPEWRELNDDDAQEDHGYKNKHNEWDHPLKREVNVVDTARTLVEQELQRALTGMQHCHQVCPLDGEIPWKKVGRENSDFMESELAEVQEMEEEAKRKEEDYEISQEEFAELLNDVTEELQKEDELLEEEIWEMERAEAMERERLMHQVDDFDSWAEFDRQQEEQKQHSPSNTYLSPLANLNCTQPLVTCPICNSSSLMETPHDGIKCTNNAGSSTFSKNNCTFQLDIAHEGLTLNHLQDQLRKVYEEHSRVCSKGILQFRMENRVGMSMLMAKCDACSSDVVVL